MEAKTLLVKFEKTDLFVCIGVLFVCVSEPHIDTACRGQKRV